MDRRPLARDCADAASALPPDASLFCDDVHFAEAGSRALAAGLVARVKARPPSRALDALERR
jgi:hypothetical protein